MESVQIGDEKFILELAYQRPTRTQGLMFRESLGKNEGMLFVFQRPNDRSFWMKNCLIDLDILFLGRDGTIVNIERMTVPDPDKPLMHYYSDGLAQYAIELAAGTAERLGLKAGDKINFPPRISRIIPDPD